MERKKLALKMTIASVVLVLISCIIPIVHAGRPPFIQELPFYNNLAAPWITGDYDMEFDSTENLHFRIGAVRTIEERENDWWPKPPWKYRLWINDEEITLQRYTIPYDKEVFHPPVAYFFYHIFGPDYFSPGGEYLLKWELWVKNPYQGDGLNEWRVFVDYWGINGDPGTVWSYEYYLNIY